MSGDRTRAILDSLGTVTRQASAPAAPAGAAGPSSDNPLGLRFLAGARVLDLATGQRGVVETGHRISSEGDGVFHVRFADGSHRWRGAGELEPDPTPAAPAGK